MATNSVMIVEDDFDIRDALRELLELEGYPVLTATNGREALDLLTRGAHPGLVLLDMMMPVMNGWQFLDAVRADPKLSSVSVVAVTAQTNSVPGANGLVRKPYGLECIMRTVRRFCGEPDLRSAASGSR